MNLKEMFIDSIKYSIKGRWEFLFLGLLLYSLSAILFFVGKFPLSALLFIPWTLFLLIEGGYVANIVESTIWGSDTYPKFENFKNLIWRGLKEIIIVLIYLIIPTFLLIILFFDLILFNVDLPTLILFLLFIVSLFLSFLMVQGAIIHYEYNHSKFKSAFEIITILKKLRKMGIGKFISSFLVVILITIIIEPSLTEFSEEIHPIFAAIFELLFLPFVTILIARFTGLIGRHHFKED
ncbi:DUF4013 domain-containing protein [Methanobrevibacter sp. TMH8]|uniref:DUF4013 domain-containing protein n=1 Tax=Methanobrevibacter sp. TMH8 TaxID=2848611 RepID=UPI001CC95AEC|nr:DUF4013 domain-containing protein [Methanobrevibacter sp. TMH8]MBZ9571212.1 DUF4013 domain-containing protein [Methanobrevibacter sp. TMH8]